MIRIAFAALALVCCGATEAREPRRLHEALENG